MIEPTQQERERAVEVCAALGLGHCAPGKCEECDREREIIAQALADARAGGISPPVPRH